MKKLYRVNLRGLNCSVTGTSYEGSYVVAENPTEAYNKVRNYLDGLNIGFYKDREMNSIDLIADESDYPECQVRLFL